MAPCSFGIGFFFIHTPGQLLFPADFVNPSVGDAGWLDGMSYVYTSTEQTATPTNTGTASATVCDIPSHTSTFTATSGHDVYNWTTPSGATLVSGGGTSNNTATYSFSGAGAYQSIVTVQDNGLLTSDPADFTHTLIQDVSRTATPSMTDMIDDEFMSRYFPVLCTLTATSGHDEYLWVFPIGSTAQSGQGTNQISFRVKTGTSMEKCTVK